MGGTQLENGCRHRQQRVQVKRASMTAPDQRRGARLTRLDPLAKLPRQDAAAVDRQISVGGRLRHGADKNLLLDGGKIQLPGMTPDSARRRGEGRDGFGRPADRQMMVEPVRASRRARPAG